MASNQKLTFGDVCREVKLSTRTPIEDGYDRYIGLEHLDSGSLKIKRWGSVEEDNPSFTRVFKAGHILFGKRRPYLRKAAIAEFDGICSGDIVVMELKGNYLKKELLPYLIQSASFWNWAIQNSSGSLSPRTKFSLLAKFEVKIPTIEKQDLCHALFQKAQDVFLHIDTLCDLVQNSKNKVAYDLMLKGNWYQDLFFKKSVAIPAGWKLTNIDEVLSKVQYGLSEALHKTGKYSVLRMMNITNGYVDPNDLKYVEMPESEAAKYLLKKGDIVFNRTNSMEWVGRTGIFELDEQHLFASYLIRLIVKKEKITAFYLNQYLNLPLVQYRLKAFATPGVSQANINPASLKSIPILLPPMSEIKKIDSIMRAFDAEMLMMLKRKKESLNLLENLKNEYFS